MTVEQNECLLQPGIKSICHQEQSVSAFLQPVPGPGLIIIQKGVRPCECGGMTPCPAQEMQSVSLAFFGCPAEVTHLGQSMKLKNFNLFNGSSIIPVDVMVLKSQAVPLSGETCTCICACIHKAGMMPA